MKLVNKERQGSKIRKRYDEAQTPYQRIMASPDMLAKNKQRIQHIYFQLYPADLRGQLDANLARLWRSTR
jgi:hypothetical protein